MDEKEIIKNAFCYGPGVSDLDAIIAFFAGAKERNLNLYYTFRGVNLYSLLDDEESCYKKVIGMTKEEFIEKYEAATGEKYINFAETDERVKAKILSRLEALSEANSQPGNQKE